MKCRPAFAACCAKENGHYKTLSGLFKSYLKARNITPRDDVTSYSPSQSFDNVLERAAWAKRDDNKRHSHQYRAPQASLKQMEITLKRNKEKLKKISNFEYLISLIGHFVEKIPNLGELYIYDTSLRIGRHLRLSPEFVYLHSGTREGAKALKLPHTSRYLKPSELPKCLQIASPEIIEDFLCVCRDELQQL
jgi:hypothetical protein